MKLPIIPIERLKEIKESFFSRHVLAWLPPFWTEAEGEPEPSRERSLRCHGTRESGGLEVVSPISLKSSVTAAPGGMEREQNV